MPSLTNQEIMLIVNQYIGVDKGYLQGFSYRSLAEFYPLYCGLEKDPLQYDTLTNRERFIKILQESDPDEQSNIIKGVLVRCPVESDNKPPSRTKELYLKFESLAGNLSSIFPAAEPKITSKSVLGTLHDIEVLVKSGSPESCIDRVHTLIHGYLRVICNDSSIVYKEDDGITKLFKTIRNNHPAFTTASPHSDKIYNMLNAMASILDNLNPVRNTGSRAHPNEDLLPKNEASMVINVGNMFITYIDNKICDFSNPITS